MAKKNEAPAQRWHPPLSLPLSFFFFPPLLPPLSDRCGVNAQMQRFLPRKPTSRGDFFFFFLPLFFSPSRTRDHDGVKRAFRTSAGVGEGRKCRLPSFFLFSFFFRGGPCDPYWYFKGNRRGCALAPTPLLPPFPPLLCRARWAMDRRFAKPRWRRCRTAPFPFLFFSPPREDCGALDNEGFFFDGRKYYGDIITTFEPFSPPFPFFFPPPPPEGVSVFFEMLSSRP